jgi:hypothetical protein
MPECGGESKWKGALSIWHLAFSLKDRADANRKSGGQVLTAKCQMLTRSPVLHYLFHDEPPIRTMQLSKEYVGYLAREVTKKLIAGHFIETKAAATVTEKVHAAILDEFSLEDRINDEVRVILEAYSAEMQKTGANYQEMFRKVKNELVRKYKAVL